MDPRELMLILEAAQAAVDAGAPMHQVNQQVRIDTNNEFAGVMSLALAMDPKILASSKSEVLREAAADEAIAPVAETSPVRDFAEEALNGLVFGFGGEIFGDEFAAREEARSILNPGAQALSQAAGLLVPGAATGGAAARAGGGIIRRAGALAGVGAAESGAVGAGLADPGERLAGGLTGAAVGGVAGLAAGTVFPILGGLGRMLRSDKALARVVAKETVEQTGRPVEDIFDAVRARQQTELIPQPTVLADVDPVLAQQAERFATAGNAQLRRAEGPLDALRARVRPEQLDAAQRQVYAPFDGTTSNDARLLRQLRANDEILDATRRVVPGEPSQMSTVRFEQLQSIRNGLKNQFASAKRSGDVDAMNRIAQSRLHLDQQIDRVFPGFQRANDQMAELLARQEGAEELIQAIDKALPQISPDVPQVGGMFSSTYKAVARPARRRKMIMEMVGEALLEEGTEGMKTLERMVRDGTMAKLFSGIESVRGATRGGALALPGLLTADR
jgi:hypothetical protein